MSWKYSRVMEHISLTVPTIIHFVSGYSKSQEQSSWSKEPAQCGMHTRSLKGCVCSCFSFLLRKISWDLENIPGLQDLLPSPTFHLHQHPLKAPLETTLYLSRTYSVVYDSHFQIVLWHRCLGRHQRINLGKSDKFLSTYKISLCF